MKISLILLSVIVFVTVLQLSSAYKWPKNEIPNPFSSPPPFCNLVEMGTPLCDPDSILDKTQVDYILKSQKEITHLGKCPCNVACKEDESGLVVGIVLVKEYDNSNAPKAPLYEGDNPQTLNEFAAHIRQKWNLGTCDNAVLLTIASNSKQYGISIGENGNKVLNDTWISGIVEENFRDKAKYSDYSTIKNILFMFRAAIREELSRQNEDVDGGPSSLTESNGSTVWYTITILAVVLLLILVISVIAFVLLRHRKENDDVSLRDVWTKKFWLKAGNQYKAAKQSETNGNDKDVEKQEEEVKQKLASTEDLKPVDDIENVDEDKIQYPKLSKV